MILKRLTDSEGSLLSLLTLAVLLELCGTQRTILDKQLGIYYRPARLFLSDVFNLRGYDEKALRILEEQGKMQKTFNLSESFFCDAKNGPGRRSDIRPTSVHRLRPGDIDIIGALGDSITSGNGILATNFIQMIKEDRGVVWSIGGQGTWRQFLTLPNILKEFNPNLYGYSLKDGLASERSSKFNVAEPGAMSRDIPYEARILVKRLQNDPNVNMTHDWKLITLLIGNNDFCSDYCFHFSHKHVVDAHKRDMIQTYRYLRDNVPRLMINVVPMANLVILTKNTGFPAYCDRISNSECSCLFAKNEIFLKKYEHMIKQWIAADIDVAYRNEFNTETFTVNVQPFTQFSDMPRTTNNTIDRRNLAYDCFHLSQKGQASSANALWNNMLEREGQKSNEWINVFEKFKCPSEKSPFIATRKNSENNFH